MLQYRQHKFLFKPFGFRQNKGSSVFFWRSSGTLCEVLFFPLIVTVKRAGVPEKIEKMCLLRSRERGLPLKEMKSGRANGKNSGKIAGQGIKQDTAVTLLFKNGPHCALRDAGVLLGKKAMGWSCEAVGSF